MWVVSDDFQPGPAIVGKRMPAKGFPKDNPRCLGHASVKIDIASKTEPFFRGPDTDEQPDAIDMSIQVNGQYGCMVVWGSVDH